MADAGDSGVRFARTGCKVVVEDRRAYFIRRAGEARGLAAQAADEHVRTIHLEMAIRYELMAKSGGRSGNDDDESD
jgi:hypothetical protein